MKALICLLAIALSWAATVGIVALIGLCFSIPVNFAIGTGVWLIMILVKGVLYNGRSN